MRLRIRLRTEEETSRAQVLVRLAGLANDDDAGAPGPVVLLCEPETVSPRGDADFVLALTDGPVPGADDFLVPPLAPRLLAHRAALIERLLSAERGLAAVTPLRVALDLADDMVFRVDFGTRIRDVNAAACRRLGFTRDELLKMSIRDLSPNHDPTTWAERWARVASRGTVRFESFQRTREGEILPVDVTLTFLDGQGRGEDFIVSFVRDTSERKQIEAGLLLADRLHALGIMAAETAHEMATPVECVDACLIALQAELAAEGGAPPDRRSVEAALRDATDCARRLKRSVASLRAFARGDAGAPAGPGRPAAPSPTAGGVSVDEILDRAYRMTRRTIEASAVLAAPGPTGLWVRGDTQRLVQVIVNLLMNAQQSMPERLRADNLVELAARRSGDEVRIEVRDNGQGMTGAVRARIFDPFFSTKPPGVGTGLGLSVCHGIVAGLDGRIEVESAPGEGARFTVVLPAMAPPERAARFGQGMATQRKRVLVVDDEAPQLRAMSRLLGRVAVVTTASTVDEALDTLSAGETYDLILCDLNMPDRPGTDLHAYLVAERPELVPAFHLTTGGVYTESSRRYLEAHQPQMLDKCADTAVLFRLLGAPPAGE